MDFYNRLARLALGRLGWSEDQVLWSDINAIIIGVEEHDEMLVQLVSAITGTPRREREITNVPRDKLPAAIDSVLGLAARNRRK